MSGIRGLYRQHGAPAGPRSGDSWIQGCSPAFRLMIATSWLAPDSWRDKQEHAIREPAGPGLDWVEYLHLVDRHRTPALSWAALKRVAGLDVPEFAMRQLQTRNDTCHMRGVQQALLLAEVLKAFNSAAIPIMPLKGPLLSLQLYGDVGLRQCNDLDIMVVQRDVPKAMACLESLGFTPDASFSLLSPRQWQVCLRHDCHIIFLQPRRNWPLELHWRNDWESPERTAHQWVRNIPSTWHGHSFFAMNPVDQVLFLTSHGSKHGWFRAKWLGDLARIVADDRIDWLAAHEEARSMGQQRPLLLGLFLLKEAYGLHLPAFPEQEWKTLPTFPIDKAISDLKSSTEPASRGALAGLVERLRSTGNNRLLRPHETLLQSLAALAYCRYDFTTLRLPDSLFWAYTPLRPLLWAWRHLTRKSGGR